MDEKSSDSSDENNHNVNEASIINGLFGIAEEDNNVKNSTAPPESTDDINMETEEIMETIINELCEESDQFIIKITDEKKCSSIKDDKHGDGIQIAEGNHFGSHILCSESADLDPTELPSSFATISKNYEKSKEHNGTKDSDITPENCSTLQKSDSNSTVLLSKGNQQSTLSLISKDYQVSSSDESDSSDDDDSCDDVDGEFTDSDDNSIISVSSNTFSKDDIKTKGEIDICDLPPIEDLKISVDEAKCEPIGCIKSIVDTLVIVETFLNKPALDIDSVLFVDRGQRALGRIFDVFGPVIKPLYAVRFNNANHIKKFDVKIKEPVYCAPRTEYTSYVLVSQLLKMKGSDASWKDDNEPPREFLDYSDDEAEKLAKKKRKQRKRTQLSDEDDTENNEKSPEPPSSSVVRNNPTSRNNQSSRNNPTPRNKTTPRNNFAPRNMTPRPSYQHSNNQPHPAYCPRPPNYGYGPRQFPTYAQHLSAMEYSHTYRQPYNPWYYDSMYASRHNYPPNPYMAPGYDYGSQPPMNPNNPGRFHYPEHFE